MTKTVTMDVGECPRCGQMEFHSYTIGGRVAGQCGACVYITRGDPETDALCDFARGQHPIAEMVGSDPCPRCGGKVTTHAEERWFLCDTCGLTGDVIRWSMERRGGTFREALTRLTSLDPAAVR